MANAILDPKTGKFRVFFRLGKQQFNRTVRLEGSRAAERLCAAIEGTIQDLNRGRLVIPEGADRALFILSGGKVSETIGLPARQITLGDLLTHYQGQGQRI